MPRVVISCVTSITSEVATQITRLLRAIVFTALLLSSVIDGSAAFTSLVSLPTEEPRTDKSPQIIHR